MYCNFIARYFLMSFWGLLVASASLMANHGELVLLSTNDVHARIMGVRNDDTMCNKLDRDTNACFGGFDRIASAVNSERSLKQNVLLLDAGDQFQGTMFHVHYQGLASARLMNQVGYDAMAPGNHEFDHGPKVLAQFSKSINFPLISANIDVSKSPELKGLIKPYIIIKKYGLKIGILGYTTEDTAHLSTPGSLVTFLPIIESVNKAIAALKKANVDVIIALSHAGLNKDIEVAKHTEGIAAIICGHTNSLLSNSEKKADGPSPLVVKGKDGAPVLLTSAYAYGKFLGKLKFSFDNDGKPYKWSGEPIKLTQNIKPDQGIRHEIDLLYQPIQNLEKQTVGSSVVHIDGQTCRFQECAFGNLLADSMLNHTKKFGAQVALMNGGGIRASLRQGIISFAQLQDIMPFEKTLVLYRLNGSTIKDLLEHGVSYVDDRKNGNTGRFLQVAGLKYSFDSTSPRGRRIKNVFVSNGAESWMPLDSAKTYGVVTNSYMAAGGDSYTHFNGFNEQLSIPLELKELVARFLSHPLSQLPKREGRIIDLNKQRANPPCALAHHSLPTDG